MAKIIPLNELQERGVYRLNSRNLLVGVWNGKTGFIGIREKFDDRFLFTEYHWDTGAPYGTAKPLELIGFVPEGIEIVECEPTLCSECKKQVEHVPEGEYPRWKHTEDKSPLCLKGIPTSRSNRKLFAFLEPLDDAELAANKNQWYEGGKESE